MELRWVAIVAAVALVTVSLPAEADFHPDCSPPPAAYANTGLEAAQGADGTELVFEGLVYCPSSAVDIHDVRVAPVGGDALADTANEGCQATTASPCTASDTIEDPGEGLYAVNMTFSTPGFQDVERLQEFYWSGHGQPVPVCVNAGFVPVPSAGSCLGFSG